MKLNFPVGIGIFEDPSGGRWAPDANGQVDIAGANPDPFLVAGFTYVTDPGYTTGGRPTTGLTPCMPAFDTTLGKPIWRNATNTGWIDATGTVV